MTIEIKQLVIRAVVERKAERKEAGAGQQPTASFEPPRRSTAPQRDAFDRHALVADCARIVLRELRKERER
jgi:hypothetical protein